jgi:CRISPR-associated protein Cas2
VFVAVILDPGSDGRIDELDYLLEQYGFRQIQKGVWESTTLMEKYLSRLKRDIDRKTDSYDKVRMYQYPLEGSLSITSLIQKSWKRVVVKI